MDISEFLIGKDLHDKNEALDQMFNQIENKYISFFKKRPPKFEGEEHDRLHNHWLLVEDNYSAKFGFDKDSDIPEYIKSECLQAFIKVFGPVNK
jgi:hypothetical protein